MRGSYWGYFIQVIIVGLLVNFTISCKSDQKRMSEEVLTDTVYEEVHEYKYGICVDSLLVYHGEIEQDINVSDILTKFGLSLDCIHQLDQKARSIYDLRKIKAGNIYAVFLEKDSTRRVKFFVYEIDPIDYIICEVGDSICVRLEKKDVRIVEKEASGVIESSLWSCMKSKNMNPLLAIELSDVYAWTIDFFALQKGDHFKVRYKESFVDSLSIGITEISCAVFNHMGQDIYAIPFEQDSMRSFYDSMGMSLRRAFLKAPLRYSRISSRFSKRRLHPILRIVRPHWGVDYTAPIGTPVQTIGDGVVTMKAYRGGAGNMIRIRHNTIYESSYMHLSRFCNIKVGTRVHQGDVVGYVGSTGLSTGAHLDFRIYKYGHPIDPLKVESPSVKPVKEELMDVFSKKRDSVLTVLSKVK